MSLLRSKGTLSKAAQSIDAGQVLRAAARSTLESALGQQPGTGPVKPTKPLGWAAKPVLMVAGGIAGITAASAAVSAVRRTQKEA